MKILIRVVTIVLSLPKSVGELLALARHLVQSVFGNPRFASPSPTLAEMNAAMDGLETAATAADSHTKGAVQVRDEKERTLRGLMRKLGRYVQDIADANPGDAEAIVISAGLKVKKVPSHTNFEFEVRHGKNSGEALLISKRQGNRASYEWQYSTDQKTWTNAPSTVRSRTTISGLTPGVTYYFRRRIVSKAGVSDWSQVVSLVMI